MGNVTRGRQLLVILLGVWLGAMAWLWVRYPPAELGKGAIQVGLWGVLPVFLALRAGLGASWARRALAVVWGLRGVLELLHAQGASANLGEGDQGPALEVAATSAVLAVVALLSAIVVLVQKDIREMTRGG